MNLTVTCEKRKRRQSWYSGREEVLWSAGTDTLITCREKNCICWGEAEAAEEQRGAMCKSDSQLKQEVSRERGESLLLNPEVCSLSTSACGRRRPGAVLQTPAPSNALHGVAAKTRVRRHVPELEHRPPHHPIGHVEGGATGHPCTTAQMERPTSYSLRSPLFYINSLLP